MPPTRNWKEFAMARLFPSKNRLFIGELKSSKELVTLSKCFKKKRFKRLDVVKLVYFCDKMNHIYQIMKQ